MHRQHQKHCERRHFTIEDVVFNDDIARFDLKQNEKTTTHNKQMNQDPARSIQPVNLQTHKSARVSMLMAAQNTHIHCRAATQKAAQQQAPTSRTALDVQPEMSPPCEWSGCLCAQSICYHVQHKHPEHLRKWQPQQLANTLATQQKRTQKPNRTHTEHTHHCPPVAKLEHIADLHTCTQHHTTQSYMCIRCQRTTAQRRFCRF